MIEQENPPTCSSLVAVNFEWGKRKSADRENMMEAMMVLRFLPVKQFFLLMLYVKGKICKGGGIGE